MVAFQTLLATAPPGPDGLAMFVRLLVLLIAVGLALLISVALWMRLFRRRHEPARPRKGATGLDPWMEAGRRLDSEDA